MHALAVALTPALAALGAATSPGGEWRHFASLAVVPRDHNRGGPPQRAPGEPGWMAACYRLTTRVERVSARAARLDLGVCTDSEAQPAAPPGRYGAARPRGCGAKQRTGPSRRPHCSHRTAPRHPPSRWRL
jgi:hypothetical protein